jgi:hypothetical protein
VSIWGQGSDCKRHMCAMAAPASRWQALSRRACLLQFNPQSSQTPSDIHHTHTHPPHRLASKRARGPRLLRRRLPRLLRLLLLFVAVAVVVVVVAAAVCAGVLRLLPLLVRRGEPFGAGCIGQRGPGSVLSSARAALGVPPAVTTAVAAAAAAVCCCRRHHTCCCCWSALRQ